MRVSREHVLLGNYEAALSHYHSVKTCIDKYLNREPPSVRLSNLFSTPMLPFFEPVSSFFSVPCIFPLISHTPSHPTSSSVPV